MPREDIIQSDEDERVMPLIAHLGELRTRLIRSVVAIAAGTAVGFWVAPPIKRTFVELLPSDQVQALGPIAWSAIDCGASFIDAQSMKSRAAALSLILTLLTACADGLDRSSSDATPAGVSCPSSFEEAQDGNFDESMFVGAGHVIRFVPSPDREYRGYDINITRPLTRGAPFMDTGFLRIDDPVPGIAPGDTVLLVAERTERNNRLFTPGPCVPLVGIPESFVEP